MIQRDETLNYVLWINQRTYGEQIVPGIALNTNLRAYHFCKSQID